MNVRIKNSVKKLICVFLCALTVLLPSCGSFRVKSSVIDAVKEPEKNTDFHSYSSSGDVLYSDGCSYQFDEKTYSVNVRDTESGVMWSSLMQNENDYSSVFGVQIIYKKYLYVLNSQDNGVALGGVSYDKNDNGVTVHYDLKENAQSETLFSCDVEYKFDKKNMSVSCDISKAVTPDGAVIVYFDLLPSFGEYKDANSNDYFLVPDSSGAVMYTSLSDSVNDSCEFDIYGSDPAGDGSSEQTRALMPVFGSKKGNSSFIAYIDYADAAACVYAQRPDGGRGAYIFARFKLSSSSMTDSSVKYTDFKREKVGVTYMFLSGAKSDYSSMAGEVREYMIKNGDIDETRLSDNTLPFILNAVGHYDNGFMKTDSETTFGDCETLINILKARSVDSVNVVYKGIFKGGMNQKSIKPSRVLSSLGGKSGLDSLYSFMRANNGRLFVSLNCISAENISVSNTARSVLGNTLSVTVKNDMSRDETDKTNEVKLLASSGIEKMIPDIISVSADLPCDGVVLSDAGDMVYSDCTANGRSRIQTKNALDNMLTSASGSVDVSVSNGNFYTLKSVKNVTDMPLYTSRSESASYKGIPFAQMIMHGYVNYWGESVNLSDNYKLYMLKCIEYGSPIAYEWVFDETSALYYGYTLSDAVDYYTQNKDALGGLSSSIMVSHSFVKDGVAKVVYENGAQIYINYNNYSVITDDNLTVLPYSALRVG